MRQISSDLADVQAVQSPADARARNPGVTAIMAWRREQASRHALRPTWGIAAFRPMANLATGWQD